jgi:Domain of unknown function (DUF4403)
MRLPKTIRSPKTVRLPGMTGSKTMSSNATSLKTTSLQTTLGRLPVRPSTIAIGAGVVLLSFGIALTAMDWLSPSGSKLPAPALKELPPLPPVTRSSYVVAPVVVALSAIRDIADRSAPRNFAGKADNAVAQVLQNADIGWTASRGPIAATGGEDMLTLSTPLTGRVNITGSLSSKATGAVGDAIAGLLGNDAAKRIGGINIKALNANAEIKGNVVITSRPKLAAAWRLEPNLGAQVNLGDTNLSVAGARVNVPAQVKPVIDKTVGEQLNIVAERIRNDPIIERTARQEWAKACRSVPLQGPGATTSLPLLWLELKPTRAIAAQPRVDGSAVTLTMGIEADTRITPTETQPDCPFPDKITIVPPTAGGVSIAVPIDLPFSELSKIVDQELAGKTFPEDGSGPVAVTVKHAEIKAAGNRLLISLLVRAKEKASFFGLGAEATIHIWGNPVLDQGRQTLRLGNMELAVESEAAFGLLGAAARTVMPHLQGVLAEKAIVDLKPFANNAREKIAAAIADFQKSDDGVKVTADISNLTLADIAFDSKTLRIIAAAEGAMNVNVTSLPGP